MSDVNEGVHGRNLKKFLRQHRDKMKIIQQQQ